MFNFFPCTQQKRIFSGILVPIILTMVCSSAQAQSASASRGFVYVDQGISVYWPYHALLMTTGFILLVVGFAVVRLRKTPQWYKTHMTLEISGGICIIAGLFVGIYMVTLSGFPHLHNIHEILGVIIAILLIITIVLGSLIKRTKESKKVIRMSHRWLGRISLALIVINIILGFLFLSIILRQ
jgi:cytochrome b561